MLLAGFSSQGGLELKEGQHVGAATRDWPQKWHRRVESIMESLMQAKDLQAEIGHEEDSFAAYWIVLASCMCHVFAAVCMCSRSNTSRPRPATLKSVDFSFKMFSGCRLQRFAAILECQGAQEVHGIHKLQVC